MLGIEGKERQGGSKTDGADERRLPLRFFSTFQTSVFPLNPISASCWPLLPPLILIGSTQPPFSHNKRKKKKPKSPENLGKAIFPPLSLLHRPREEDMTKRDGVPFFSLALLSNHVGHFPLKDIFWLGPAVASEKN